MWCVGLLVFNFTGVPVLRSYIYIHHESSNIEAAQTYSICTERDMTFLGPLDWVFQ